MALKEYEFTNETGYTTVLLLSDEDAKARGLKAVEQKQATEPKNKQAKPADKK